MITKEIRKVRCDDALNALTASGTAVFFTLTTPDVVDFDTIRARWRSFRHDLFRFLRSSGKGEPLYIMNYELHPGYLQKVCRDKHGEYIRRSDGRSHGWHIHGVCSCWLPAFSFLEYARRSGFGRCDFRRVKTKGVSDYLTKHALKAYRGLSDKERKLYQGSRRRLVNCSRGLPALRSYEYRSSFKSRVDSIFNYYRSFVERVSTPSGFEQFNSSDYRKLYLRATVCALLRVPFLSDLPLALEKLRRESIKKSKVEK